MKTKTKVPEAFTPNPIFVVQSTVKLELTGGRHCEFHYDDPELAREHYLMLEATGILMGQVIKRVWME
jgi:hypothetical protein